MFRAGAANRSIVCADVNDWVATGRSPGGAGLSLGQEGRRLLSGPCSWAGGRAQPPVGLCLQRVLGSVDALLVEG